MPRQRTLGMTVVGTCSVFLGIVAGFTVLQKLVGFIADADDRESHLIYGSALLVAAILGVTSGLGVLQRKWWCRDASILFSVVLILFGVMLAIDERITAQTEPATLLYAALVTVFYPIALLASCTSASWREALATNQNGRAGETGERTTK